MTFLDARTIALTFLVASLVNAGMLALLWHQNGGRYRGLDLWLAHALLQAAGLVVITLRGIPPGPLALFLGLPILVAGNLLLIAGLERFASRTGRAWPKALLGAGFVVVHAYFIFVSPNLQARNINLSVVMTILGFWGAALAAHSPPAGRSGRPHLAVVVMVVSGLANAARILINLLTPRQDEFFRSAGVDTAIILLLQVLSLALTFALILIVNERLIQELQWDVLNRREAEAEVRRLNADLDARVQERTARLQAANQELEAYAFSISHDLRTPLRAAEGFSSILLDRYEDLLDEDGRHYLRRIQESALRMGALTDDLLTLSRFSYAELHRKMLDLAPMAREILQDLQSRSLDRQVSVVVEPEIPVAGDPSMLRIVMENLLGNAWKFTSKRPDAQIEVGLQESRTGPIVRVKDNGAGFDLALAGTLFRPFQRFHRPEAFPGNGIGLATVQRIVARHGGRCWAESEVGTGSTFYFTLEPDAIPGEAAPGLARPLCQPS